MTEYGKSPTQSLCPRCGEMAVLLAPIDLNVRAYCLEVPPAFFICFGCRHVGQVGVGEVIDLPTIEERLDIANLLEDGAPRR